MTTTVAVATGGLDGGSLGEGGECGRAGGLVLERAVEARAAAPITAAAGVAATVREAVAVAMVPTPP